MGVNAHDEFPDERKALQATLAELRSENALLRRRLDEATGPAAAGEPQGDSLAASIQQQKTFYELILDNVDLELVVFSVDGRYEYVNPRAVSDPEIRRWIIGMDTYEYCARRGRDPGVAERRHRLIREAVERGTSQEFEEVVRTPAGEERVLLRKYTPVRDLEGRVVRVIGQSLDITARKRAEEALRAQRAYLRAVIDASPSLIFAKDRNARFTLANRAVAEIYGTVPEGLIGKTDAELNPDLEEVAHFERLDREVIETGRELLIEEEPVTHPATGVTRWFQTRKIRFMPPDGDDPQVLGIATDITERRAAEMALRASQEQLQQAQKVEAMGRLAGGIAHDFNNLLTVIRGSAELALADADANSAVGEDLLEIKRAAERAAGLTRQLLAYTRKQVLQPRVLDLNAVVRRTDQMLRRLLGTDIELVTVLDATRSNVCADAGQLEQVLVNLVVNARDAMPRGGKLLIETSDEVRTAAAELRGCEVRPGCYVALRVTDTGSGIAPELLSRVFEPFFTTKPPGQGTGLGLSTACGIVQQSGGYIWASSTPGAGTSFNILLPGVEDPVEDEAPERRTAPPAAMRSTILVVEDEITVRQIARRILRREGYTVIEAENGDQALRVVENGPRIDLVLTDMIMPLMGGREFAERLSALRPNTPVVFMSGFTTEFGGAPAERAFIQKPFTPQQLLATVAQALASAADES